MIKADRIIVCCTGDGVTGGPELLHQLVHQLRILRHQAYIAYYPFDQQFSCPEAYQGYDVPQTSFLDLPNVFIIVPETATRFLKHLKHAKAAVWWLSVDNYFCVQRQSRLTDLIMRYKTLVSHRLPLRSLHKFTHFSQSQYASEFLAKYGINSMPLTDYLGKAHLESRDIKSSRLNIVVYNPKKGAKQTIRLREANPDIEFIPIQNMTSYQVAELLSRAKIYMDFGHHPGKDRPPREAALAGCCVITGRQGSAKYFADVSIPDEFKLDDTTESYISSFRPLVQKIFSDFDEYSTRFELYRDKIRQEPIIFCQQVESIFGHGVYNSWE